MMKKMKQAEGVSNGMGVGALMDRVVTSVNEGEVQDDQPLIAHNARAIDYGRAQRSKRFSRGSGRQWNQNQAQRRSLSSPLRLYIYPETTCPRLTSIGSSPEKEPQSKLTSSSGPFVSFVCAFSVPN